MAESKAKFDRRTVGRYMEKGLISDADFKNHLKTLPDDSANAEYVQMDLHDAELGEEDTLSDDDDSEGT